MLNIDYQSRNHHPSFKATKIGDVVVSKLSKAGKRIPEAVDLIQINTKSYKDRKIVQKLVKEWKKLGGRIELLDSIKNNCKPHTYLDVFYVFKAKDGKKLSRKNIKAITRVSDPHNKANPKRGMDIKELVVKPTEKHGSHERTFVGLGKAMISEIAKISKDFNFKNIQVAFEQVNIPFYKKVGFNNISPLEVRMGNSTRTLKPKAAKDAKPLDAYQAIQEPKDFNLLMQKQKTVASSNRFL